MCIPTFDWTWERGMLRMAMVIGTCAALAACAAQTPDNGDRRAGEIAPDARPFPPTQSDPIDPVTGMTDREMKVR